MAVAIENANEWVRISEKDGKSTSPLWMLISPVSALSVWLLCQTAICYLLLATGNSAPTSTSTFTSTVTAHSHLYYFSYVTTSVMLRLRYFLAWVPGVGTSHLSSLTSDLPMRPILISLNHSIMWCIFMQFLYFKVSLYNNKSFYNMKYLFKKLRKKLALRFIFFVFTL